MNYAQRMIVVYAVLFCAIMAGYELTNAVEAWWKKRKHRKKWRKDV